MLGEHTLDESAENVLGVVDGGAHNALLALHERHGAEDEGETVGDLGDLVVVGVNLNSPESRHFLYDYFVDVNLVFIFFLVNDKIYID